MIEVKVRRIGNSLGVVLPKEVIDRLDVGLGESLFLVEAPDGSYLLTKSNPADEKTERAHLANVSHRSGE